MAVYSGKPLICGERTTLFGFRRRNEMLENSEGIILKLEGGSSISLELLE